MSVTSQETNIEYITDGFVGTFAVPFYFVQPQDLLVQSLNGSGTVTDYAVTTDFAVQGIVDIFGWFSNGANIVFNNVPNAGLTLLIARSTPRIYTNLFMNGWPFTAESLNHSYDRLTLIDQELTDIMYLGLALGPPILNNVNYQIGNWFKNARPTLQGPYGWVCVQGGFPGPAIFVPFGWLTTSPWINSVGATPPLDPQEGNLWFDTVGLQLYIWYNDGTSSQWVPVINQGPWAPEVNIDGGQNNYASINNPVFTGNVYINNVRLLPTVIDFSPPLNPAVGQLWFDTFGLQTYIWYDDGTSAQWVPVINQEVPPTVNPDGGQNNYASINNPVFTGSITLNGQNILGVTVDWSPPLNPVNGQLWFDTFGLQMYIWYEDPTSAQWVPVINQEIAPAINPPGGQNNYAPLADPAFTGNITLNGDVAASQPWVNSIVTTLNFAPLVNPVGGQNNYAPVNNPTFSGTVFVGGSLSIAGNPAATQAWVNTTIANYVAGLNLSTTFAPYNNPIGGARNYLPIGSPTWQGNLIGPSMIINNPVSGNILNVQSNGQDRFTINHMNAVFNTPVVINTSLQVPNNNIDANQLWLGTGGLIISGAVQTGSWTQAIGSLPLAIRGSQINLQDENWTLQARFWNAGVWIPNKLTVANIEMNDGAGVSFTRGAFDVWGTLSGSGGIMQRGNQGTYFTLTSVETFQTTPLRVGNNIDAQSYTLNGQPFTGGGGGGGVASFNTRTGAVTLQAGDLNTLGGPFLPVDNPTFTGSITGSGWGSNIGMLEPTPFETTAAFGTGYGDGIPKLLMLTGPIWNYASVQMDPMQGLTFISDAGDSATYSSYGIGLPAGAKVYIGNQVVLPAADGDGGGFPPLQTYEPQFVSGATLNFAAYSTSGNLCFLYLKVNNSTAHSFSLISLPPGMLPTCDALGLTNQGAFVDFTTESYSYVETDSDVADIEGIPQVAWGETTTTLIFTFYMTTRRESISTEKRLELRKQRIDKRKAQIAEQVKA